MLDLRWTCSLLGSVRTSVRMIARSSVTVGLHQACSTLSPDGEDLAIWSRNVADAVMV